MEGLWQYGENLGEMFAKLKEAGSEVIFLAPCMMNTYVSCHLKEEGLIEFARQQKERENEGILKTYFQKAKEIADQSGVRCCDCYSKWKHLNECGVDTTELLVNYTNHPTREMHWYLAMSLVEVLFSD